MNNYDFKDLIESWDYYCMVQEQKEKINDLFNNHELSLFFKKGENYFGAPENSRIIFAKLKNDDEDEPMMPDFKNQAKFIALDILKAMSSDEDPSETMFGFGDIPSINVCDRDEVIEKILSYKPKKKDKK